MIEFYLNGKKLVYNAQKHLAKPYLNPLSGYVNVFNYLLKI